MLFNNVGVLIVVTEVGVKGSGAAAFGVTARGKSAMGSALGTKSPTWAWRALLMSRKVAAATVTGQH